MMLLPPHIPPRSLVPDLASTCPDASKRAELLAVHREAFTPDGKAKVGGRCLALPWWAPGPATSCMGRPEVLPSKWGRGGIGRRAQGVVAAGASHSLLPPPHTNPPLPQGKGKWVPPEAAAVAARLAEQNSSWQCGACTLVNAPSARVCEACGQLRPSPDDATNQWKQQAPSGGAAAAAAVRAPAPAPAPAGGAGGGWAAAARPAPAPAPAPASAAAVVAPVAPPPSSADAFPALPSAAPSRGAAAASSSSAAGGSGGGGGGKKKGKKSLQEFVKETKVHPQVGGRAACAGAWAPRGRAALLC